MAAQKAAAVFEATAAKLTVAVLRSEPPPGQASLVSELGTNALRLSSALQSLAAQCFSTARNGPGVGA